MEVDKNANLQTGQMGLAPQTAGLWAHPEAQPPARACIPYGLGRCHGARFAVFPSSSPILRLRRRPPMPASSRRLVARRSGRPVRRDGTGDRGGRGGRLSLPGGPWTHRIDAGRPSDFSRHDVGPGARARQATKREWVQSLSQEQFLWDMELYLAMRDDQDVMRPGHSEATGPSGPADD